MHATEECTDVPVVELDEREAHELFDRVTRRELKLSREEFLAAYDAGEFDDVNPDEVPGLLDVLMALPFGR